MTRASRAAREDRKALLVARGALDRARITLAVHEIKAIVAPPPGAGRVGRLRSTAAMLVAVAGPLLGFRKLSRFLRFASIGLFALRVVQRWRG
jgi:hypothetical protein